MRGRTSSRLVVVDVAIRPVVGHVLAEHEPVDVTDAVSLSRGQPQLSAGDARHDRPQRRMTAADRGPLGEAVVGVAEHADDPVAPRLSADPVDRVVAVVGLVDPAERGPLRAELAPHVLDDHRVATGRGPRGDPVEEDVATVLVVGQTDQDGRDPISTGVREVHIGGEPDAVAHADEMLCRGVRHRLGLDPDELHEGATILPRQEAGTPGVC